MARRGVVVTGMGCLSPLGTDVASTWDAALAGRSGVRALPELDERLASRIAATAVDEIDPGDLHPKEARRYDRTMLLALAAAREALADAGIEGQVE
ncbi:MAG: beta-ketoacyl synthase N-terminal-like domain-containing protein, partial [Myxococcota bacterium]